MTRTAHLTTQEATRLVKARTRKVATEIGCQMHTLTEKERYVKVNLRKRGLGVVYLHHLAVIADNRYSEIVEMRKSNSSKEMQLSHLCHHTNCINPKHIVLESASLNRQRNSCKGQFQLSFCINGNNYVVHPCTHSNEPVNKRCILPLKHIDNITPGLNTINVAL